MRMIEYEGGESTRGSQRKATPVSSPAKYKLPAANCANLANLSLPIREIRVIHGRFSDGQNKKRPRRVNGGDVLTD